MQTLAAPRAERQPARPPVASSKAQADRVDAFARRVARLGYGVRDPETFFLQREGLATELHELAKEMRQ